MNPTSEQTKITRAHVEGCAKALSVSVDLCECGGRDIAWPLAEDARVSEDVRPLLRYGCWHLVFGKGYREQALPLITFPNEASANIAAEGINGLIAALTQQVEEAKGVRELRAEVEIDLTIKLGSPLNDKLAELGFDHPDQHIVVDALQAIESLIADNALLVDERDEARATAIREAAGVARRWSTSDLESRILALLTPQTKGRRQMSTTCDKCRGSRWVPTDGERDAITEEPRFAFQLLIPTAWMPCTCSPLWSLNPDLAVTNLDVWRCEGVTGI